jgi:hypothetical protein
VCVFTLRFHIILYKNPSRVIAEHEIHVVLKQEIWEDLIKLTFNCVEIKFYKILVLTIYVKMQIYNDRRVVYFYEYVRFRVLKAMVIKSSFCGM